MATDRLTPENVVRLDRDERELFVAELRDRANELLNKAGRSGDEGGNLMSLSSDELVECGALAARALPDRLIGAARLVKNGRLDCDVLLVRDAIPPALVREPTPSSLDEGPRWETTRLLELALLGYMSLFGEPFSYASLYGGRLVQDIVPVPGQEAAQTSGGSDSFLDWHNEDAFSPDRCDHFGLLCLRDDPAARTQFALARGLDLDRRHVEVLRQPRFVVRPDVAHGADETPEAVTPVTVLTGPDGDPEICYDSVYLTVADEGDEAAASALAALHRAVAAARRDHVLRQGDLLVLDNRRAVHARTAFQPRFDGTDRWLLRTMTCSSPLEFRRRGAVRVIA